ncbi:alpha/beta hydrolase family protein [Streptomyces sp. NPDC054961]
MAVDEPAAKPDGEGEDSRLHTAQPEARPRAQAARKELEALQHTVTVGDEKIACGVLQPHGAQPGRSAVVLHGAGTADQSVHRQLAHLLAERGCRVLSPDFSGHGASTGQLRKLSLERRFQQARSVIDELVPDTDRLVLVGASMSGQTVGDLLGHYGNRITAVALLAPAVYARRAWDLPFDAGFTEVIRTPGAWRDSAALDAYTDFRGRAVLVVPAEDHVIPPEVNRALVQALSSRADFTHLVFPDATHHLGRYFRAHPDACTRLADALTAV